MGGEDGGGGGGHGGGGAPAEAGAAPAQGAGAAGAAAANAHQGQQGDGGKPKDLHINNGIPLELVTSPMSPRAYTPNPFSRKATSLDLDDYFTGPRDIAKHSKWPIFLQMHGSILPKMIVPLLTVGG